MDRKLKPIYDAIDARNYKQALKQCENYLEKKSDKTTRDTQLVLVRDHLYFMNTSAL